MSAPGPFHPRALVETDRVGRGTTIGAFTRVLPGASIGAECRISDQVFIQNDVSLGDRVTIQAGAQIWDGARIEDDAIIGPNVTCTNEGAVLGEPRTDEAAPLVVRKGVSIGAGAVLLPGITVGQRAVVEPGSVVTRSVPPFAIVAGNPARIVGYVGKLGVSSGDNAAPVPARQSRQLAVRGASIHVAPIIKDLRGNLSVRELGKGLPFAPKRYFIILDVPSKEVRGEHAHRRCAQLLVCVRGSMACVLDDGRHREEVVLDSPEIALHLPPMVWAVQYKHTDEALLLVLASHEYDPGDYIRDYDEFLSERRSLDAAS